MKKILPFLLTALLLLTSFINARAQKTKKAERLNLQLEEMINNAYPPDGAGAVVLIRKNGKTLLKKAYGQINIEHNIEARTDMKFRIASITKQFTAVSILMLVEQGKLTLDDNIKRYIPEYKQCHTNVITIRQLLGHTAGIPNYTDVEKPYDHHGTDRIVMDSIISVINDYSLNFKPGTNWKYSNSGFVLLGKIIENISRQKFRTYVKEHIFDILGMKQSSFYDFYDIIPGLSKGYEITEENKGKIVHAKAVKPGTLADGGIVSTVNDLTIWYDAIKNNSLITEQSKKIAFTSQQLSDGRKTNYGLGWWTATLGTYATVEHGGNIHGSECYSLWIPEKKLQVIILSNLNRSNPAKLAVQLASTILKIPSTSGQLVTLKIDTLKKFVGVYQHDDGTERIISLKNSQLYSQRGQGKKFMILPVSSQKFIFKTDPTWLIEFTKKNDSEKFHIEVGSRTTLVSRGKQL